MNERFLSMYTELIFLKEEELYGQSGFEDRKKADIIMLPGNAYHQMAQRAAELYKEGAASYILPSGKYGKLIGKFEGPVTPNRRYTGPYPTECDFLTDILKKNGVPEDAIFEEKNATYTYENAIFSREVTDRAGLTIQNAIICCHAFHARRSLLYYQLLFPETEFRVCPVDTGINRHNWFLSERGIKTVLGEVERCGVQFHKIIDAMLT